MADLSQFPAPEVALVTRVKGLVHMVLDLFSLSNSIPDSFWGALTCGETGAYLWHDLTVPAREEPAVLRHFENVLSGAEEAYGGFKQAELSRLSSDQVKALASSHGLTQVMGYNALSMGFEVSDLDDPHKHFDIAAALMARFCEQFGLDPLKDFEDMATCWNAGHPGPTAHTIPPEYAANVILRMQIWEALP